MARRAHRKIAHRGTRAVVRQFLDHRKPGPAVGTARRPIPVIPSIAEDIGDTLVANRDVRRNRTRASVLLFGRDNAEVSFSAWCDRLRTDRLDPGEGRVFLPQIRDKRGDLIRRPLDFDFHTGVAAIAYRSREPMRVSNTVHERTKPDSLHNAGDGYPTAFTSHSATVPGTRSSPGRCTVPGRTKRPPPPRSGDR